MIFKQNHMTASSQCMAVLVLQSEEHLQNLLDSILVYFLCSPSTVLYTESHAICVRPFFQNIWVNLNILFHG